MIILATDFTGIFSNLAEVMSAIILLLGLIAASKFTLKLKEKRYEAIFSFYSRLNMYLLCFKVKLGTPNRTPLLKRYTSDCFGHNRDIITIPEESEMIEFNDHVIKFIGFLMDTDNQIPVSKVIFTNIEKLKEYLVKLLELGRITPYSSFDNNKHVEKEYDEIIETIDVLLSDIKEEHLKLLKLISCRPNQLKNSIDQKTEKTNAKNLPLSSF